MLPAQHSSIGDSAARNEHEDEYQHEDEDEHGRARRTLLGSVGQTTVRRTPVGSILSAMCWRYFFSSDSMLPWVSAPSRPEFY